MKKATCHHQIPSSRYLLKYTPEAFEGGELEMSVGDEFSKERADLRIQVASGSGAQAEELYGEALLHSKKMESWGRINTLSAKVLSDYGPELREKIEELEGVAGEIEALTDRYNETFMPAYNNAADFYLDLATLYPGVAIYDEGANRYSALAGLNTEIFFPGRKGPATKARSDAVDSFEKMEAKRRGLTEALQTAHDEIVFPLFQKIADARRLAEELFETGEIVAKKVEEGIRDEHRLLTGRGLEGELEGLHQRWEGRRGEYRTGAPFRASLSNPGDYVSAQPDIFSKFEKNKHVTGLGIANVTAPFEEVAAHFAGVREELERLETKFK